MLKRQGKETTTVFININVKSTSYVVKVIIEVSCHFLILRQSFVEKFRPEFESLKVRTFYSIYCKQNINTK